MRAILSFIVFLVTLSTVIILLWIQRSRHIARISAKADSYWDGTQEKRRFKRFKAELAVDCTIPERPGDTYKTFSKDISGQGICLTVPEIIPQGGVLSLHVSVPGQGPIKILGEVVWVKEAEDSKEKNLGRAFNAGIKFLKIDSHGQKALDNFLIESAR
jgi:c-di-GMP-binding flagellar brake protein YcgR